MDINNDLIKEIVRYGTLATSADNCQPWLFNWDGLKLELLMDKERSGFFYDINHESTYMTLGAVAENIAIAASHFGFKAAIEFAPETKLKANIIAHITFARTANQEDPLFKVLENRTINRYPFKNGPISNAILNELKDAIPPEFQTSIQWFTKEDEKKVLRAIVFNADRILFEDERLHSGLFKWIWTESKDATRLDGMSLDIIGLNVLQKPFFKLLADWGSMEKLNKFGFSRIPALNSIKLLKSSPVYCLLNVKQKNKKSYFDAGRVFEKLWIKANAAGLAIQPMAGFVFLFNHYLTNEAKDFQQQHRDLIQRDFANLKKIYTAGDEAYPAMFLRLGYPTRSNIKSKRRPVVAVLTCE